MTFGQTLRPVFASKWAQKSVSAPNTYRGSSPRACPTKGRTRSSERVLGTSRPRSLFAPSYRPIQKSGSTSQARSASYARARGRGRAEEKTSMKVERRRASNQSAGAARQCSHDHRRNRFPLGWRSRRAWPLAAPVRCWAHSPSPGYCDRTLTRQKTLHLKDFFSLEHEVHRPPEFVTEDGERLSLAMLSFQALAPFFDFIAFPQHQHGRLAESPAKMGILDLSVAGSSSLAAGLIRTFHETHVGGEVLYPRETIDVVNFIEDGHGQDLSHAVYGPQPVEVGEVVYFDAPCQKCLHISNDFVQIVREHY